MKSFKQIALSAFITISAFGAVLYTSCNKDECKDVVCQNGGTCSGGTCTCPTGVGGTNCETIFRTTYANSYVGNGSDNDTPPSTYTNFKVTLSATGTDLTKMEMVMKDNVGNAIFTAPVTLSDIKTTGSVFTITSTSADGYTYTGSGNVTGTNISTLTINSKDNATNAVLVITFTNMAKQ
jgi:hypothetical protein